MKTCTLCNQPKVDSEFPYRADFVCLPCHRESAYRWSELPWADTGRRKPNLSAEERERRRQRAKGMRVPRSDVKPATITPLPVSGPVLTQTKPQTTATEATTENEP